MPRKKLTEEEEIQRVLSMYEIENAYRAKGYINIAGVDEAGRGPLAGPVYAAAVILPPDAIIKGINDSKKLSEKRREELFDEITEKAVAYNICSIDEKRIDEINILNATYEAMNGAVNGLKIQPDFVLIDGNRIGGMTLPHETVVKGDAKSISIAAASILAKVSRDRFICEMAEKYPEYGFEKHKGYGTKAHNEAILKYGPCEIHRRTFLKKLLGENI
ncbi:MAG: ribonuclease HII [Hominilimicola sp.]